MSSSYKYFLSLLFVLNLGLANSQIVIKVLDKENKEPIPYCHISVENLNHSKITDVFTDVNGEASIEFQKNKKLIINISFVGYKNLTDTLDGNKSSLTHYLESDEFKLDEVVITGQNKPVPIDKSIYNIKIIGAKQIEQKAATDLSGLLNNELNVRIINDPALGSSLKLQGMAGENIKIMVDGVPLVGRLNGNIDLSQVNLNDIDHIEIVEGPMSVMYGTNALGGLINIITKENKYARYRTTLDSYYESVGSYNINGSANIRLKSSDFGFHLGRNFFQGYSPVTDSRFKIWKPKEQYNTGLQYTFANKKLKSKNKFEYFRERLLDRDNPLPPYGIKAHDTWFVTNRWSAMTNLAYDISEKSNIDVLISYSYYNREKNKYVKDLTNLETQLSKSVSDHDTSTIKALVVRGVFNGNAFSDNVSYQVGVDANRESAFGKRIIGKTENMGDYAMFTSFKWNVTSKFSIQPAIRFAYNTKYDAPLVPSMNLMYAMKNTSFRFSYARGFRAPSLKELYLRFFDSNHQVEGNPNLGAEYSHNFNIAVKNSTMLFNKGVKTKFTGFYNTIKNRITLVQVDPDNPIHFKNENIGNIESLGWTFNLTLQPFRFMEYQLGFSQTGIREDYYDGADKFVFHSFFNSNFNFNMLNNTLHLSIFYKYYGKYPAYGYDDAGNLKVNYLDPYHSMDVSVIKDMFKHKLSISAGVKNVFDNTFVSGNLREGGNVHSGGSNSTVVGWGRTFFVGVKYNLIGYE